MSKQIYVPSDYGILDEPTEAKWYVSDRRIELASAGAAATVYVPTLSMPSAPWASRKLQMSQYSSAESLPTSLGLYGYYFNEVTEENEIYVCDVPTFARFGPKPGTSAEMLTGQQFCQLLAKSLYDGVHTPVSFTLALTAETSSIPYYNSNAVRSFINGGILSESSIVLQNAVVDVGSPTPAQDIWGSRERGSRIAFGNNSFIHTPASEFTTSPSDYSYEFDITSENVMQAKNVTLTDARVVIQCNTRMALSPQNATSVDCSYAKATSADFLGQTPVDILAFAASPSDAPVVPIYLYNRSLSNYAATGSCALYLGKRKSDGVNAPELLIFEMDFTFDLNINDFLYDGYAIDFLDCPKS